MRGLEAVVLVGAGRFSEVRLEVKDHVQIFGDNGNGKSTICRALLFFYLGEAGRGHYGLDASKQDWPSYYLAIPRSYVIFQVSRGENLSFHIVVTRPGHAIQFLFVDTPYRREDYMEETGPHTARIRSIDEIIEGFDSLGIHYEKVDSYGGFQDRIYGIKSSPYNVFQPAPAKHDKILVLGQSIAGMFRASIGGIDHMDLGKFRNVLVSTVSNPQEAQIDIREIANNIRDFTNDYQAIAAFRRQEQTADDLLAYFDDAENSRRECESMMREFASRSQCVAPAAAAEARLHAEALGQQQTNADAQAKLQESHRIQIEALGLAIGAYGVKVAEGEKVIGEFQTLDIASKRAKLDALPGNNSELAGVKSQVEFLEREFRDEQEKRNQALNLIHAEWNEIVAHFNSQNQTISEQAAEEQLALSRDTEERLDAGRRELDEAIERLEAERGPLRQSIETLEQGIREALSQPEPEPLRDGRTRLGSELTKKTAEIRKRVQADEKLRALKNKDELETVTFRRTFEQRERALQVLHSAAVQEVIAATGSHGALLARKKENEQKLRCLDESLAVFFRTHHPEGWSAAARALDSHLLFQSAAGLSAEVATASSATAAFGVELDTASLPESRATFDRSALEAEEAEIARALRGAETELAQARGRAVELDQQFTALSSETEQQEKEMQASQIARRNDTAALLSEIDDAIQACNQRIEFLEHQIEVASHEFRERQAALRIQLEGRKVELKTRITQHDGEIVNLRAAWKKSEEALKDEAGTKVQSLRQRRDAHVAKIRNVHAGKAAAMQARRDEAERQFLERITDKGADAKKIEALTTRQRQLETAIAEAVAVNDEVVRMEGRWAEHVVPLPRNRDELKKREEQKARAEQELDSALGMLRREAAAIDASKKAIETRQARLQSDATAAGNFKDEFPGQAGLLTSLEIEPAAPFNPGTLGELLREIHSVRRKEADVNESGADRFKRFRSGFSPEHIQLFGWSDLIETDWKIFTGGALRPFIRNNTIAYRKGVLTEAFGILVNKMTSQLDRFQDAMGQVRQTARRLGEFLEGEKLVDVIDFIQVKVEEKEGRLLTRLRKIGELRNLHFGSDVRDLFAAPASQEQVEKAILAFAELSAEIALSKKDVLALEECFDLQVRVSENGVAGGWDSTIKTPGSHGTAYLVKMSIYLALLEIIRHGTFRNPAEVRVHCLFDEAGTISPRHIDAILAYAERKQITLIAAGQAQSSGAFSAWFQVWKSDRSAETQFFGQLKASRIKDVTWT